MISEIKALASDIDMTLAFKGGDLPALTIQAFTILHEHGVPLGLATGREISSQVKSQGARWGMGFEFDFLIGMNGGMLYTKEDDSLWSMPLMSTEEMKRILFCMMPVVDKYRISVNVEGGGNTAAMNIGPELIESAKRHHFTFVDKTGDIDGFCAIPAYKFLFRSDPRYDGQIRALFREHFGNAYQIIETYPGTLEIMRAGYSKGSGLARWCRKTHTDISKVIAFGDNENDDTLLQEAGWGVCLCDGSKATMAFADDLTDYGCEDAGVGRYLIDHYLKPKGWIR